MAGWGQGIGCKGQEDELKWRELHSRGVEFSKVLFSEWLESPVS